MKSKTIFKVVVLMAIFAWEISNAQNTISLNNLQYHGSDVISIDVNIVNSDTIEGMQIPISFKASDRNIVCDSVSFPDGGLAIFDVTHFEIFSDKSALFINAISNVNIDSDNSPILPGTGTLCKLFFTLPEEIERPMLRIRAGRIRDNYRDLGFKLWTPDAREVEGEITPFTFRFEN